MKSFAKQIEDAALGELHLFYVGQAGYILKNSKGETLSIDLYLSDCVERVEQNMGVRRLLPKILSEDEIELDYIITTHPHLDHFDIDSVPLLMKDTKSKLLASVNCEQYEKEFKMDGSRITYVKPGDTKTAGDYTIHFVNCDHGTGAPDAVGVIIEVDGKRIYMAGDTCLRLDRVPEYKQFGEIDVLIGPINGAYGNMNEEDFAKFSKAITPKLTIPCHYGMFPSHGGDTGKFMKYMENSDCEYLIMTMGGETVLGDGSFTVETTRKNN